MSITYIDDLPELDEQDEVPDNIKKFIRHNYSPPNQAGMVNHNQNDNLHSHEEEVHYTSPPPQQRHYTRQPINCVEVSNHVESCPICSKFYKNDNSMYIITIVVLAIICVLLLKKVLSL